MGKPLLRQLDRTVADGDHAPLRRAAPELVVFRARHPFAKQMDVVEPDEAVAVVMVRHAVDAGQEQRVEMRQSERRRADARQRDRSRQQLLEAQRIAHDRRVRDVPVQIVDMLHAEVVGARERLLPVRVRIAAENPRVVSELREHRPRAFDVRAIDQQVGVRPRP